METIEFFHLVLKKQLNCNNWTFPFFLKAVEILELIIGLLPLSHNFFNIIISLADNPPFDHLDECDALYNIECALILQIFMSIPNRYQQVFKIQKSI